MHVLFLLFFFLSAAPAYSAVFNVASGDVDGLIAAIDVANANGEENTINLEPGTYALPDLLLFGVGINGSIRIQASADAPPTVVQAGQQSGIFTVRPGAELILNGLTIQGSLSPFGAIDNSGNLTLYRTILASNGTVVLGPSGSNTGGILNEPQGIAFIESATIASNGGDGVGGIRNRGWMTIKNSSIVFNVGFEIGGISSSGHLEIVNSTVADNNCTLACSVGGIAASGFLSITNSTISDNLGDRVGGLSYGTNTSPDQATLRNTIIAGNMSMARFGPTPDCGGAFTSLGNNIIGNLTGCDINLQPSDLTGDPGLGDYIDDGVAGHGHLPLLSTSQAIDHGNADACSSDSTLVTDQLGQPRSVAGTLDGPRICDIGAVEFFPVVNDLVRLQDGGLTTDFVPTPLPTAPAGMFVITATFENISNETIFLPFFEVVTLELQRTSDLTPEAKCSNPGPEPQPILLNADGGPGQVQCFFRNFAPRNLLSGTAGARLTPQDSATTPFAPGTTKTVQFSIGLQSPEPFNFLVNVLGERRSSTAVADVSR